MDATLKEPKKVKAPKKRIKGIESKKSMYGRMFILPWCIGMLLFFIIPLFQSLIYSFSTVWVEPGLMETELAGLDNYKAILNEDPNYTNNLWSAIQSFFKSMPIIIIVSLILAIVLNQKYPGRMIFRSIFFVPVIVATGVVMELLTKNLNGVDAIITLSTETENVYSEGTGGMDFTVVLQSLNFPEEITKTMSGLITNIFNTLWSCGIPIILFLAGLQTIPEQLYEASTVEGATKWEEFWYITLPMLSQTLLLVIVFTMIDLLTQNTNPVIQQAYTLMSEQSVYDQSAAMLWLFFGIIGLGVGIVIFLYNKFLLKKWS